MRRGAVSLVQGAAREVGWGKGSFFSPGSNQRVGRGGSSSSPGRNQRGRRGSCSSSSWGAKREVRGGLAPASLINLSF